MAGSKARGPLREWGDSPPWGGSGAPVDRSSARPDFLDRGGFDPETTALAGVRLPWNQPGKPFFADAGELLDELLGQLRQLTESVDLEKLIQRLLGPQCFTLGVVYGVGENFVVSVLDLMGMFKTLLLAELYDSTRRNPGWTVWQPGGVAKYLTAQMLNEYFGEELHQAAEERDALWAEIKRVFENPGDFFGGMRDQYVKKFNRLLALSADPSPESQFQAGRVFGDLLMDVLVVIGAGAAVAKVASKVPRLLKLAGKLKGKVALRRAVGAGEAEVSASRGGPPTTKRASPPPRKEPKVEVAAVDPSPPLPWTSPAGLVYTANSREGSRIKHVLAHTRPDTSKPLHSVFNTQGGSALDLVDEAWLKRGTEIRPGVFEVDMNRVVGTVGETKIRLVVKPGTQEITTAFPIR